MDMVSSEKGGAVLSQCVVRLSDRAYPMWSGLHPKPRGRPHGAGLATVRYRPNGTGTGNGINACR